MTTKYISIEGLGVVAKKVTGGPSPGTYWIHTDRLGSIDAVTKQGGLIVFQRTYRPYGETLAQSGSHTESRGWIDQRNDTETGLTYLHARYFDPQVGTFLSPDPIGVAGGMNLYGYGLGDPIGHHDRSGLRAAQATCFVDYVSYYGEPAVPVLDCYGSGGASQTPTPTVPKDTDRPEPRCEPGDSNCKEPAPECKAGDPECQKKRRIGRRSGQPHRSDGPLLDVPLCRAHPCHPRRSREDHCMRLRVDS